MNSNIQLRKKDLTTEALVNKINTKLEWYFDELRSLDINVSDTIIPLEALKMSA